MKRIVKFLFVFLLPIKVLSQSSMVDVENLQFNDAAYLVDWSSGANFSNIISKNLFTGTANINIPLYNYSDNGINASVSLVYNTSGILVDDIPSNVGLGWNLNTGGYILRQVRGALADEIGYWLGDGEPYSVANITGDLEQDIFYLNFNGRNFKFLISNSTYSSGNVTTIPQSNIKIDRYVGSSLYSSTVASDFLYTIDNLSFVVTDEQGNKFTFVRNQWTPSETIIWTLQNIVTYEGESIAYNYSSPFTVNEYTSENQIMGLPINIDPPTSSFPSESYCSVISDNTGGQLAITKTNLTSIVYPNGITINFNYDPGTRCDVPGDSKLDGISIVETNPPYGAANGYGYNFNYSYFTSPVYSITPLPLSSTDASSCDPTIRSTQYRLKLNSINIVGFDGSSTRNYYTFRYNGIPLPERTFGGRDYFGYSNGQIPSLYHYPTHGPCYEGIELYGPNITLASTSTNVGLIATSDPTYVAAANLQTITNGKGGQISLTYTPLITYGIGSSTSPASGLVISEIDYNDGYNTDNNYSYIYNYSNPESFVNGEGTTVTWNIDDLYDPCLYGCYCAAESNTYYWKLYSNNYAILNQALNGSRYGFKTVQESIYNNVFDLVNNNVYNFSGIDADPAHGISNQNIYTPDFVYTIPSYVYCSSSSTFNAPFGPFSANKQFLSNWGIGLLVKKQSYDYNNILTEQKDYIYNINTTYISSIDNVGYHGLFVSFPFLYNSGVNDTYFPFTGNTYLLSIDEKKYYNSTQYVESIVNNQYDDHFNVMQQSYTNSKGEIITSNNYYNYSWSGTSSDAISKMNSDGIQRLLYSDKWKNGISTSSVNTLTGFSQLSGLNVYDGLFNNNIIRPNYYYILGASSTSPITTTSYLADEGSMSSGSTSITNMKLAVLNSKFDDVGNVIEQTDNNGNGGNVYNAKIINNETGKVLAEVANAQYQEIAYSGFESDYTFPSASSTSSPFIWGNCSFSNTPYSGAGGIRYGWSLVGRCSYVCTSSDPFSTTGSLITGKQYTVSYWLLNDGVGSVAVQNGSTSISTSIVGSYTNTYGEWDLYKGTFTASAPTISITGTSYGLIDEVKLYPSNSIMVTHNYLPLIGKIADVDQNDNITTYEYDPFGILTVTRDQNGNIISKTKTVVQGY